MVSLLEALPVELVGTNVLGFLSLKDIAMMERACDSKKSQQAFLQQIAHRQPVELPSNYHESKIVLDWFVKKQCKLQSLTVKLSGEIPWFHIKNLEVDYFDLQIDSNTTIESLKPLVECNKGCKVRSIKINEIPYKDVMEQLSACTRNVKQLKIMNSDICIDWLTVDILSRWKLTEVYLYGLATSILLVLLIVQTCSELTSIKLYSNNIDDSAVSAIAQHCPKLETLALGLRKITWASLVSLSEHGLPLKELYIDPIPISPTADIARRCSHALSRIRHLNTHNLRETSQDANILLPYMTGLTSVFIRSYSHFYIPLLTQYCTKLTKINDCIHTSSAEDIMTLCCTNPQLRTLYCHNRNGFTDTILIKLIHACPHLHTLWLPCKPHITDTGILTLSEHCPQLQYLHINKCHNVTEAAILQLLQRCHNLTRLEVSSSSLLEETWAQLNRNTQKRVHRC